MLASPTRAYENAWLLLDSQVRTEFDRASQSTRARSLSPHQLSSSSLIHRPRPRRERHDLHGAGRAPAAVAAGDALGYTDATPRLGARQLFYHQSGRQRQPVCFVSPT